MGTTYGDISEETGICLAGTFLERGKPKMMLGNFAQTIPMPKNKSQTLKARRYEALPATPKPLQEGVTPKASSVRTTDVFFQLGQYGDLLELTDVVADTHEDPVLQEFTGLLGESAAEMLENIRIARLLAGTNVFYANGATRSGVNARVTKDLLRRVEASLKVNRAKRITQMLRSTNSYGTVGIKPAFIGICHPYMTKDLEDLDGFKRVEDYGSVTPWDNEIGALGAIRFLEEDLMLPFEDAGGAVSDGLMSTGGTKCDVFPMFVFGRDSYADVALKGYRTKNADSKGERVVPVEIKVLQPNIPRGGDPLGQRGSVGYKTWWTGGLLQDLWFARIEAAVSK